jgi:uncharacterized membrane protein YgcG
MTRLRWLFALPAFLIAISGPSDAAEIRDKANLFSPEAVKKAEADLERIEKEYSVPVQLETIDSLEGRSIDAVLPEHARAADAKGLYVLIAKKDHKIEVETYKSYAKYLTRPREVAIRDAFTHEFKAGNYDAGLSKGIDKIDSTLSEAKAEAGGTLKPTTAPAPHRGGQAQPPVGRTVPGRPSSGGMSMWLTIGLGLLALFIVIRVLGAIFSGGNRGYAGNQRMMGPGGPGYGQGYGGPGYGGGGGGGGGFMSSMFGGIGGALAGNWLYDQFSGRHHDTSAGASNYDPAPGGVAPEEAAGPDYVGPGDGGADWGGGGADAGGGDWGGGGADAGGGDWGGGGGGGDWGGGGGGDWGGGGGGDGGGSW